MLCWFERSSEFEGLTPHPPPRVTPTTTTTPPSKMDSEGDGPGGKAAPIPWDYRKSDKAEAAETQLLLVSKLCSYLQIGKQKNSIMQSFSARGLPWESSVCAWTPGMQAACSLEGENSLEDQKWRGDKWRLREGHLPLDQFGGPGTVLTESVMIWKKVVISWLMSFQQSLTFRGVSHPREG